MSRRANPESLASTLLTRAGRRHLGLFLDYDGTLTPITESPGAARLGPAMRLLLRDLGESPRCRLALLTGRSAEGLASVAGELPGVTVVSNGGFRISGSVDWTHPEVSRHQAELRRLEALLAGPVRSHPGAFIERKGLTFAVHYRVDPQAERPLREALTLARRQVRSPLRIIEGKAVFEVQPDVSWGKGEALRLLASRWGLTSATLYAGDDAIDEEAFSAVQELGGLGVLVATSDQPTEAGWRLESVEEVQRLLHAVLVQLA